MLKGKSALITGSVGGLGLAAAERFAAAGCHIVLSGFAEADQIAQARTGIERTHGVRTLYSSADLRRPEEIEQMFRDSEEAFGGVDILVNNAVDRRGNGLGVEEFPVAAWDAGDSS